MKDNAMPPENDIELLARLEKDYDLGYDAQTEDRYYAVDKSPASRSRSSRARTANCIASSNWRRDWTGTRCRRNAT